MIKKNDQIYANPGENKLENYLKHHKKMRI